MFLNQINSLNSNQLTTNAPFMLMICALILIFPQNPNAWISEML